MNVQLTMAPVRQYVSTLQEVMSVSAAMDIKMTRITKLHALASTFSISL